MFCVPFPFRRDISILKKSRGVVHIAESKFGLKHTDKMKTKRKTISASYSGADVGLIHGKNGCGKSRDRLPLRWDVGVTWAVS